MAYQDYQEYLRSPLWKETRQKRLEIDEHKCAICDSTEALNVHHLHYKDANGKSILGNENVEEDLRTLCHTCHAMLHRIKETTKEQTMWLLKSDGINTALIADFLDSVHNRLFVEIFIRDKINGGDLELGGRDTYIRRIIRIVFLAFTDELSQYLRKHYPHDPHNIDSFRDIGAYGFSFLDKTLRENINPQQQTKRIDYVILREYELVRKAMKCNAYKQIGSLSKVSKMFNCNVNSLSKILTRYGYNAGAKIR